MEIKTRIVKRGGTIFIKVPFVFAQALELNNYLDEKKDSDRVLIKFNKKKITITLK